MKDYFNLRKSKLLLFTLLAALVGGVSPAWADDVTVYDGTASNDYLPVYGYYVDNSGSSEFIIASSDLTALNGKTIEQMVFYLHTPAAASWGSASFNVYLEEVTGENYDESSSSQLTDSKTKVYAGSLDATGTTMEIPFTTNYTYNGGNLLVAIEVETTGTYKTAKFYGTTTSSYAGRYKYGSSGASRAKFIPKTTFVTPTVGPALTVFDGSTKLTTGYEYPFGLATAGTEKPFTLKNPGTESITVNIAATNGFGVNPASATIAAKGEATLTVTMPNATATGAVTITPTTTGVDVFTINVNGTLRDASKVYVNFADGNIPEGWSSVLTGSSNSYPWTASEGYASAKGTSASYQVALTSPLLTYAKDETVSFKTAKVSDGSSWSSYNCSIAIEYSLNGTDWTAIETYTDDVVGTWTQRSVAIPVEGVKYIRFNGYNVHLTEIYGGQLPNGANFAIDKSSANLGVAAIGGVAEQKFTVTNSGNANLTVSFASDNADFSVVEKNATFLLTDNFGWGSARVYAWDANGNQLNGVWPGTTYAESTVNDYGETQFKVVVPHGAAGVIVNNGNGAQTEAITDFNYAGFWMDGTQNDQGHYTVTGYDQGAGSFVENVITELTVAAGGSSAFTVKMNTATAGVKNGNITLSYTAVNGTETVIPVSGTVMPEGAEVVDFNTAIPTRWDNQDNSWTIESGAAKCIGKKNLTTQKLDFSGETSPFFVMKVKASDSGSGDYVTVEGSSDNGATWTAFDKKTYSYPTDFGANTGDFATIVVSIPNTVNKLRFNGYYVLIDEIVGLKYSANDPQIAVSKLTFSQEPPITPIYEPVTSGTLSDFGWSKTEVTVLYAISNSGTGTLTISNISAPAGYSAEANAMTVAAGADPLQLTVTLNSGEIGEKSGDIVLTTDGGNFTIPVKGFIYGDKNLVDFTNASQYAGWTTDGWTISDGLAIPTSTSSSATMQTTKFKVAANEKLYVDIKGTTSTVTKSFSYRYSTDNGVNWTVGTQNISGGTYVNIDDQVLTLSDIADAEAEKTVLIQFTSQNLGIKHIYGFTAEATAVMETTGSNHAFGMQTAESDEYSFTISNTGTAALTGLSVTLGKTGDKAQYSFRMTDSENAAFTGTELAVGQTITVYVKQLFDSNYGAKSDVLTIAADEQTTVTINLTGTTRDPSVLFVNFDASNEWPAEILEHNGWSIYNYNNYGYIYNSTTTSASLILTPLTVANTTDKLTFQSKYSSSSRDLTVRYTTDGGISWNEYVCSEEEPKTSFKSQISSSYKDFEVTNIPTGTVAFDFYGKSIYLDDFAGNMKVTSAPLMTFTTVSDNISGANLHADATATYTLENKGNAAYVGTVAATNVTVGVTGDDVTFESNTLTIPAGKAATITVTTAFTAPYGEKTGSLAITDDSWVGAINVNYTATLLDPTDFLEDFADNKKPTGWYSENWTFTDGAASVNASKNSLITEKIKAQEGNNTLTFDAWSSSEVEASRVMKVYTSTNRKNWTQLGDDIALTDISKEYTRSLTNGEQYIKFVGVTAKIDNIKGVKKLEAPPHDLYEISNTISNKTTGVPGAEFTATVTAISLIADERDIVAELWLKKSDNSEYHNVAKLENQTLTANESKTFTLTGNLPDWAEGTDYKMYATVKKSDDAAHFNTDDVDFTLAQDLKLTINSFAVTTPTVQANGNNEYTATFNINVTNSSSRDLTAEEVSVSLVNNTSSDPDVVFTSTWAAANSQTVFLNPGDYTSGANMAIYRWNDTDTDEQKEWDLFTEISTGFYSAELNGKKNFIICRVNPATAEADLGWGANVYNQSDNLTTAGGNIFGNNGYKGDGNKFLNLSAGTMESLAKNVSTTLQVTATGTLINGEDKNLTFYAREDLKNSILSDGYTYVSQTAAITAAPVIALDEETAPTEIATGQNRKVILAHKFVAGWNTICVPFAIDDLSVFGDGTVAFSFDAYDTTTKELTFNKQTTLNAGQPYAIYVPAKINSALTFTGVTIEDANTTAGASTDNGVTFQGTYAPMAEGTLSGCYGMTAEGKIAKASATATMKGFRAYFNGITAGATARFLDVDDIQGISTVSMETAAPEGTYNLQGQKVEQLKNGGLYIINGKKVVIK